MKKTIDIDKYELLDVYRLAIAHMKNKLDGAKKLSLRYPDDKSFRNHVKNIEARLEVIVNQMMMISDSEWIEINDIHLEDEE